MVVPEAAPVVLMVTVLVMVVVLVRLSVAVHVMVPAAVPVLLVPTLGELTVVTQLATSHAHWSPVAYLSRLAL